MNKVLIFLSASLLVTGTLWAESVKGKISRDYWHPKKGGLSSIGKTPPTGQDELISFEAVDWKKGSKKKANFADNYAQRVYGFLIPEKDGEYTFWIASDDNSILFLSADEKAENKKAIAKVPSWTPTKKWDKFKEQKSKPIKLKGGKKYYIEAIMIEGGGGDGLSVAWDNGEKDSKPSVILGNNLATAAKLTPMKKKTDVKKEDKAKK